ncbi:MAG: thiol:disulfide interchange protein DsbA/DsbL [Steroidobacteraceae bacterium]
MRIPSAALGLLLLFVVSPAPQAALEEGKNFTTLAPPQPTSQHSKIEVVEFFSYGCPHCAHFYPLLNAWVAKLPPDVLFRRVPVGFNRDLWINLQRTYYALDASGDLARLDGPLFHALHEERKPLIDESSITDWVGRNGGNADKFAAAYLSLPINKETVQADQMAADYRIEGVPTLAIDGRYVTRGAASADEEAGLKELLATADELIARVRNERGRSKPATKEKTISR